MVEIAERFIAKTLGLRLVSSETKSLATRAHKQYILANFEPKLMLVLLNFTLGSRTRKRIGVMLLHEGNNTVLAINVRARTQVFDEVVTHHCLA